MLMRNGDKLSGREKSESRRVFVDLLNLWIEWQGLLMKYEI